MPQIRGWVGRVEEEGRWVNDALRHRRPSCVHSGPDIRMATAALTIP